MTEFKHPDCEKLHEIGLCIESANGPATLPAVRADSIEWKAWIGWYKERGMKTEWSERQVWQKPERMMTVISPWPPSDLDALLEEWRAKKKNKRTGKINLVERPKKSDYELEAPNQG